MRAACYNKFNSAHGVLRVRNLPTQVAGPDEMLVKMGVSGVNPSDIKNRRRARPRAFPRLTPHRDGTDRACIGERVWTWNAQWTRLFGTAAEFVSMPAAQTLPRPYGVSFDVGACLGMSWFAEWRAVHHQPVVASESVLVTGGMGTVDCYVIHLGKRAGIRVITKVRSDDKAQVAQSVGAYRVVNFKAEDRIAAVATFAVGGVDRVIEVDLAGNAEHYKNILRPDGLVVAYGSNAWNTQLPLKDWLMHGISLNIFIVYELPPAVRARVICESVSALTEIGFRHLIATHLSLDDIVVAHKAVESGRLLGNALVDLT